MSEIARLEAQLNVRQGIINTAQKEMRDMRRHLAKLKAQDFDKGEWRLLRTVAEHHGVCHSALSALVTRHPDRLSAVKIRGKWYLPEAFMNMSRERFVARTQFRPRPPKLDEDCPTMTIDQAAEAIHCSARHLYRKLKLQAPNLLHTRFSAHDPLGGRIVVKVEDMPVVRDLISRRSRIGMGIGEAVR
jgi:hypothetical protein